MEQALITVVVPTYNIEDYIGTCLESFVPCVDSYPFEVLVVSDGSTDDSVMIAKKYEQRYPDVFRVIEKENGGHGSTVNTGLANAKGRYFKVVDGDDWVDAKAFAKLLATVADGCLSDIIAANYSWVHHETMQKKLDDSIFAGKGICYGEEYSLSDIAGDIFLKMHNLTYRTDILKWSGLKLQEHCFYVDVEYDLLPIPWIHTVTFLEESVYCYRIGMSGQSMNVKNMQKNRKQYVRVLRRLFRQYQDCKEGKISCEQEQLAYMEYGLALVYTSYFKILLSLPMQEKVQENMRQLDAWLNQKHPKVYDRVQNKALLALRKSHFHLYAPAQVAFGLLERYKGKCGGL